MAAKLHERVRMKKKFYKRDKGEKTPKTKKKNKIKPTLSTTYMYHSAGTDYLGVSVVAVRTLRQLGCRERHSMKSHLVGIITLPLSIVALSIIPLYNPNFRGIQFYPINQILF